MRFVFIHYARLSKEPGKFQNSPLEDGVYGRGDLDVISLNIDKATKIVKQP